MKGKSVLITGAASGIGLAIAKELLKNGVQKLSIVDLDEKKSEATVKALKNEFKKAQILYIKTDVTNKKEFEAAFIKTIEKHRTIDILVNSAGILNDKNYKLEIAINLTAIVHGIILGMDYLGKKRNGFGGTIINISSIAGLDFFSICPVYSATKLGIVGLVRSYGDSFYFKKTGVQIIGLCPGETKTSFSDKIPNGIEKEYLEEFFYGKSLLPSQEPEAVAKGTIEILNNAENGSVWCVEDSKLYKLEIPDRRTFTKLVIENI